MSTVSRVGSSSSGASGSAQEIAGHFLSSYKKSTSKTVQLIDYFLVFALVTGVIQFAYVLLVGQFPFNSFLAGFIAAVGFFVFTGRWKNRTRRMERLGRPLAPARTDMCPFPLLFSP